MAEQVRQKAPRQFNKLYHARQPSDQRLHSCDRGVERRITPKCPPNSNITTKNKSWSRQTRPSLNYLKI
jgi:hypothetical protein